MKRYIIFTVIMMAGSLQAMDEAETEAVTDVETSEVEVLENAYIKAKRAWGKCLWGEADKEHEVDQKQAVQALINVAVANYNWKEKIYTIAEKKHSGLCTEFKSCNDDNEKDQLAQQAMIALGGARAAYMSCVLADVAVKGARSELTPSKTPLIASAFAGSVVTAIIGLGIFKYLDFKRADVETDILQ